MARGIKEQSIIFFKGAFGKIRSDSDNSMNNKIKGEHAGSPLHYYVNIINKQSKILACINKDWNIINDVPTFTFLPPYIRFSTGTNSLRIYLPSFKNSLLRNAEMTSPSSLPLPVSHKQ